ncbi:hypothetical protein MVEG_06658 [Podila verticillata NRRL 6337]|nr:hypothetical protein MVEG_06658 [Podila verticillata NRRL 6337]
MIPSGAFVIALVRSNPNPAPAATLTWTHLGAIDGSDHFYLFGGQQCITDDKGVFSVFSPGSQKKQYGAESLDHKGLQFTPGSNTKNDTMGMVTGTWTAFNLTGYKHRWETYSVNAVFNGKDSTGNTLMHAVVNASMFENIYLSAMNHDRTDPDTNGDRYMGLGYNNGNLYVFGRGWHSLTRVAVYALTGIPITSTSTTIPNRIYTSVNATAAVQSCGGMATRVLIWAKMWSSIDGY